MKKIIALLSAVMMLAVSVSGFSFANSSYDAPQWQQPVHNNDLKFQATYQNGVVIMTWNTFTPTSSNWKYRKVVRSTSKTNPVYPDDGYIKYAGDINFTSYTDTNPPVGTVYYGVCAITENSYGKYRNCDWKTVTVNGGSDVVACTMEYVPVCGVDGKTYSNKCMANGVEIKYEGECGSSTVASVSVPSNLSASLKNAVDAMITKLLNNLENKFGDDIDAKVSLLETLSTKLDGIKVNYRLKSMITYLVEKIDEAVALLQIKALLDID